MRRTVELVLDVVIVLFASVGAAIYAIEGSMMVTLVLIIIALLNITALVLRLLRDRG